MQPSGGSSNLNSPSGSKFSGTSFHGEILAQRMHAIGPAVRQHQALGIGCPTGSMPSKSRISRSAQFAAGTTSEMLSILRIVGRQVGEHAAQQVVLVECEIVRDQELSGEGPVIRADADHVAGIEIAEDVLADALHRRAVDIQEQTAVAGTVGPLDGGAELFPCNSLSRSRAIISAAPSGLAVRAERGAPPNQRK